MQRVPEVPSIHWRWDEWLALSRDAEVKAAATKDFSSAGQRAYDAGWVHYLRGLSSEALACADRAEIHWYKAQAGAYEQASVFHLRGALHKLAEDYSAAVASHREAVELWRTLSSESVEVAVGLNALADAERSSGDLDAAERDYREALRIALAVDYHESVTSVTGNLATLALDREDWIGAETFAYEALSLAKKLGRMELIASNSYRLAMALARQGRKSEALPHARRAVEIFTSLRSRHFKVARRILAECES